MVEWKKLGEVASIVRGNRVTKSDLIENGRYPVISGGFSPLGRINQYNREKDTITIAQYGSAGYVDWQNELFWANDVCYSVYPQGDLNNRYLFYVLINQQCYIYTLRTNAVPAHLPLKSLQDVDIPVPSIDEQTRIVGILDTFTASIENLKQQIAQRRKQYEHYRDQLLDLEGKEGVEMKTLGETCDFVRGPFGGALKKEIFVKEGFAIYEQQHAIYGLWSFRYFIDETKFSEMKRFEVKPGDILMSCSGTMGKTSIVPTDCVKGIINQALLKLTTKNVVSNRYIKLFMDSQWFQDALKKQTAGGAIQNVASVTVLKDLAIPVPSLPEQQRIVSVLDTFEASIANLEQQLAQREKQYEYYRNKLLKFD
ncbi:MAG: restriction endonuclease subunit S [Clostridia bacterium]|nr:restriction endonuclease subunit S [Clostridia bacterium]